MNCTKMGKLFLDDLLCVGPEKPLGYLPLDTISTYCGMTSYELEKKLLDRGLKVLRLTSEESNVGFGGALYAYDYMALKMLLNDPANKKTLKKASWPSDPEKFVRHLRVHAKEKTKLFDLVADAFGDKTNPGRRN